MVTQFQQNANNTITNTAVNLPTPANQLTTQPAGPFSPITPQLVPDGVLSAAIDEYGPTDFFALDAADLGMDASEMGGVATITRERADPNDPTSLPILTFTNSNGQIIGQIEDDR